MPGTREFQLNLERNRETLQLHRNIMINIKLPEIRILESSHVKNLLLNGE